MYTRNHDRALLVSFPSTFSCSSFCNFSPFFPSGHNSFCRSLSTHNSVRDARKTHGRIFRRFLFFPPFLFFFFFCSLAFEFFPSGCSRPRTPPSESSSAFRSSDLGDARPSRKSMIEKEKIPRWKQTCQALLVFCRNRTRSSFVSLLLHSLLQRREEEEEAESLRYRFPGSLN